MPKRRVGVVLLVPSPWATEIDGLRRALGDGGLGRIPTHLTLVPPVNVREDELADALDVLRAAAATMRPFTARLGPPATFLPVNPVAYLSVVGTGLDEVRRVREAVFVEPLARPLTWSFVPHVTLADEADPERIRAALSVLGDYSVDVVFDRVHLLQEGEGRTWKPVADVPFAAPTVIGRGGLELELSISAALDAEAAAWSDREWAAYSRTTYGLPGSDEPFAITARRGREVVGTATGESRAGEAYLAQLIVSASERGTGVGSHLLARFESVMAERGCTRLTLRTRVDGPAQAFYEARGWRVYARLERWRGGADFVQMERLLA
ncbi:MAG TPA: GNAT family N-acetyltransferase [Acidimicrobiales bacterium]|nr:GNAT family N-acetyltransferase [Acidimicrobiales bacterium]